MTKRHLLIISTLWFLIIGGLILIKQVTLWTGTTVLLQTVPVDPYDLFRGEYVTLSYPMSDLRSIPDMSPTQWEHGQTVYVVLTLQPDGIATATSKTPDRPKGNMLYLKGAVTGYEASRIEYGIESYFVPQGQGKTIEQTRGTGLLVEVTIDQWGNAVINDIQMSDTRGSNPVPSPTWTSPFSARSKEKTCLENAGKWIEQYSECQEVDEKACASMGGTFDECASPCRHANDPNAICAQVCIPLCSMMISSFDLPPPVVL